jgi:hypothetical protein
MAAGAGGGYTQEAELLDKVKKFLCTLITFGEGISASVGATVARNVTSRVVSTTKECLRNV